MIEKALSFLRAVREGATPELEAALSEIPSLRADLLSARAANAALSQALNISEEARIEQEKRALSAEADATLLFDRLCAWRGEYAHGNAASTTSTSGIVATSLVTVRPRLTRREAVSASLTALEEHLPRTDAARLWSEIAMHANAEVVAQSAAVEVRSIAHVLASEGVTLVNTTIAAVVSGGAPAIVVVTEPPLSTITAITATGIICDSASSGSPDPTMATSDAMAPSVAFSPPTTTARGVRVLSLDGGGVRGLVIIRLLREIERLTGRPIADSFDLIVGTSSGGILALGLTARMSLDEMESVFSALRDNFRDTSVWLAEVKRVVTGISHDTEVAESNLRKCFGIERRLRDLPRSPFVAVLATASSREPLQPFLFRSYELPASSATANPMEGTHEARLWEAARATSSAPTFFAPVTIGGRAFVDGALLANNPGLIALAEAAVLWQDKRVDVLCCIGTGLDKEKDFKGQGIAQW